MRHFHILNNRTYTPTVNIDKLWSLLGAEAFETASGGKKGAPVLDVTQHVRIYRHKYACVYACIFGRKGGRGNLGLLRRDYDFFGNGMVCFSVCFKR